MRTTITLEADVHARLERLRRTRPFKDVVNEALRAGLDELERSQRAGKEGRYTIKTVKGYPRRTNLDNIAELIAEVEGDDYK
jgi:Arc/MetJ-type ribon-helix-helix transcriptional regulator